MRIYHEGTDMAMDDITILFKMSEAKQLRGYLNQMIDRNDVNEHFHLNDDSYKHEITICLYDENNKHINNFHKRIQEVIMYDK